MNKTLCFFLADDDEDDVFLFREVLREVAPEAKFSSAVDGQDALDKLKSATMPLPHIIFLDLNMPRLDGRQCLRELKTDNKLKNVPVVMYSTSSQQRDIELCREMGAAAFITKPSSVVVLKNLITGIAGTTTEDITGVLKKLTQQLQT
ncbi:MAG: response regulator [Bacteroidota bacterium]